MIRFCLLAGGQIWLIGPPQMTGDIMALPDSPEPTQAPVGWTKVPGGYWRIATGSDFFPTWPR